MTSRLRSLLARAEQLAELSPEGRAHLARRLIAALIGGQSVDAASYPDAVTDPVMRYVRVALEMATRRPSLASTEAAIGAREECLREVFAEAWPNGWGQQWITKATRCARFLFHACESMQGDPDATPLSLAAAEARP